MHVGAPIDPDPNREDADAESIVDRSGAEAADVEEGGVLLDASREVRAKLYMGQVSAFQPYK